MAASVEILAWLPFLRGSEDLALHAWKGPSGLCALRSTKTFYLIQGVPGECNGLIWPMSPASLVSSLYAGRGKMLIQQAQEQMSTEKNTQCICWLNFCPYFSFSFWFPCFLHPTGMFEKVRFPKPLDAPQRFDLIHFKYFLSQTTQGICNSASRQTQTNLEYLRKFRPCRNTTKQGQK